MENADFCTVNSLYQELKKRISSIQGKVYLFFYEIQEVEQWEKCINYVRVDLDYLYHRLQCKASLRRAGELSWRTLCGVCSFPIFFRRISGIYKTGK